MANRKQMIVIPKEVVLKVLAFLDEVANASPAARAIYNLLHAACIERLEAGSRRNRGEQQEMIAALVVDVASEHGVELEQAHRAGVQVASRVIAECGGQQVYFPAVPKMTIQWLAEQEEQP